MNELKYAYAVFVGHLMAFNGNSFFFSSNIQLKMAASYASLTSYNDRK